MDDPYSLVKVDEYLGVDRGGEPVAATPKALT
jgi:hypothetical protein